MKSQSSLVLAVALSLHANPVFAAGVEGWLSWRGPQQNGVSLEKNLPETVDPKKPLWVADFPGQSTPVVANGKVYIMGYWGDGADLKEGVACFDAETGKKLWEKGYTDFLSDTIYMRYATSSATVDEETGNVYTQGTQGMFGAFTADGKELWSKSLMEELGRLTFPNGRTASPVIEGDLVITRGIMSNWGTQGAAGDRFYAFDKKTGELVWASGTGERPKDNSFSHPYMTWLNGKRVFFAATGDGGAVCVNARTGDPIWRVQLAKAGINATVLVHNNDKLISIYGTPYEKGQMVAMKLPNVEPPKGSTTPVNVDRSQVELWANDVSTSTSSPILVGDRIYVVAEKGDLCSIDANTGKVLWTLKLGIEQRNSCPVYADGKLYVPMLSEPGTDDAGATGAFYIIQPTDTEGKMLSHVVLDGKCFGTPTIYNGKIYLQTTRHLYCFGKAGPNPGLPKAVAAEAQPKPGPATQLQIIPSEVMLHPGGKATFRLRKLDANGLTVEDVKDIKTVKWASFIPATARVRATIKGSFNAAGELVIDADQVPSAGQFEATVDDLKGYFRGRVVPAPPFKQDFESFQLSEVTTNDVEPPTPFAYPPLTWIGARFKFEVRTQDMNKDFTKTIDNKFFQRAMVFIGSSEMKNYTIQADVMTEGNARKMSEVGVIVQRYMVILKGNEKKLEINSNQERLRVPGVNDPGNFPISPNTWYTVKARVDTSPDGSGVVRAKAWKRGDAEPANWTLEVPHKTAHQQGSPGLFGFAPQDQRVHIDNVSVTPN